MTKLAFIFSLSIVFLLPLKAFSKAPAASNKSHYEVTLMMDSSSDVASELSEQRSNPDFQISEIGRTKLVFDDVTFEDVMKVTIPLVNHHWATGATIDVCPVTKLANGMSAFGEVPCDSKIVSGGRVYGMLVSRGEEAKKTALCTEGEALYGRYDQWPYVCSELVQWRKDRKPMYPGASGYLGR